MKTIVLTSTCSLLLACVSFGQSPSPTAPSTLAATASPTPIATPSVAPTAVTPPVAPIASVAPSATVPPSPTPALTSSASPSLDDEIDNAVEQKIRRHFDFSTGRHHSDNDDDMAWIALPIVFIVFLTIFGTPVMIVAVIMFFSFSRNRAMHRTVRMMVEKGQPVPEALLNPSPVVRQRSDLRRAIKWLLWGVGIMIFLGATSGWDDGAWSLGIIPFLIGIAYLVFWRLDLRKDETLPKV